MTRSAKQLSQIFGLDLSVGSELERAYEPQGKWSIDQLRGRLVELSGFGEHSLLTSAASLIRKVQQQGELVSWVGRPQSGFYPPDFVSWGIDLAVLPVIRVAKTIDIGKVSCHLVRSGACGLIVMDLDKHAVFPLSLQGRLNRLAQQYNTIVLCLTTKTIEDVSIGSLVSLRVHSSLEKVGEDQFLCKLLTLKDKQRGPGWQFDEEVHGTVGMY